MKKPGIAPPGGSLFSSPRSKWECQPTQRPYILTCTEAAIKFRLLSIYSQACFGKAPHLKWDFCLRSRCVILLWIYVAPVNTSRLADSRLQSLWPFICWAQSSFHLGPNHLIVSEGPTVHRPRKRWNNSQVAIRFNLGVIAMEHARFWFYKCFVVLFQGNTEKHRSTAEVCLHDSYFTSNVQSDPTGSGSPQPVTSDATRSFALHVDLQMRANPQLGIIFPVS